MSASSTRWSGGNRPKPQGGILLTKDTSPWQYGCDKTPAEAGHGYTLKTLYLLGVPTNEFFLAIANPNVRLHLDKFALVAV